MKKTCKYKERIFKEYEQNYFFDTSALIKLYHQEEGT